MKLFQFDIENKTYIIFISSIIWAINFRATFKNIDAHMDTGSYTSLKYDNIVILAKNILCCLFLAIYYLQIKINKSHSKNEKEIITTNVGSMVVVHVKKKKAKKNSYIYSIFFLNKINDSQKKIIFSLKIFFLILIIYLSEEIYFIFVNNHILDMSIVPIRNIGILISILIFSPLLLKNSFIKYRHQFIPLAIIFILSAGIIFFDATKVERFNKIYGLNFISYLFSFVLMGLEAILIKYLLDRHFLSIFLILGIKGVIGTFIFTIISIVHTKIEFLYFFDKFLYFEYEEMYEIFGTFQKLLYIISLVILQYLKMLIINRFSENHLLSTLMIADIIYFPLYCIERFGIQRFGITNKTTFCFNSLLGFITVFLMLIFNEILECKFWGLNTNLKKNINKRQVKDIMISLSEVNTNTTLTEEDIKNIESSRPSENSNIDENK